MNRKLRTRPTYSSHRSGISEVSHCFVRNSRYFNRMNVAVAAAALLLLVLTQEQMACKIYRARRQWLVNCFS